MVSGLVHPVLLMGARIGNGSIIASGSVVMKGDFPENVIIAGVPGKVIREL